MPAAHATSRAASPSLASVPALVRGSPGRWPLRALARLVAGAALRRSRRGLLGLDDRLLRDVGLTPEDARREAVRPAWDALDRIPWDVPAHWLR